MKIEEKNMVLKSCQKLSHQLGDMKYFQKLDNENWLQYGETEQLFYS